MTGQYASNWRGGPVEKTCEQCGKMVFVIQSRTRANSNFCSIECHKINTEKLGDAHVKNVISSMGKNKINRDKITPAMIVMKRELLMHQRLIREVAHVISTTGAHGTEGNAEASR